MWKRPEYQAEIVGRNLKRLRIMNGFSVEDIREYLCLGSVQAIYKYENGKGYPAADALLALMELYDANVEDIVKPHMSRETVMRVWDYYCSGAENMFLVLARRGNSGEARIEDRHRIMSVQRAICPLIDKGSGIE